MEMVDQEGIEAGRHLKKFLLVFPIAYQIHLLEELHFLLLAWQWEQSLLMECNVTEKSLTADVLLSQEERRDNFN